MQPHRLISTLAVITAAVASANDAGPRARQASDSVILNSAGFMLVAYKGDTGTYENPSPTPPFVHYNTFLEIEEGTKCASCDAFFRNQLPLSTDCLGAPIATGFKTRACDPVTDVDSLNPLNNVTWSITQYGKRFVVQYNVLDPDTGKTLVACDEFSKDQFTCESDGNIYRDGRGGPLGVGLTLSADNVCPQY